MHVVGVVGLAADDVATLQLASVDEFMAYRYENLRPTVEPTCID